MSHVKHDKVLELAVIVDDSPVDALIMANWLRKRQWYVRVFRTPHDVIDFVTSGACPRLIISDCCIPHPGDGSKLARKLREFGFGGFIVMVSSDEQPEIPDLLSTGIINLFCLKEDVTINDLARMIEDLRQKTD